MIFPWFVSRKKRKTTISFKKQCNKKKFMPRSRRTARSDLEARTLRNETGIFIL